MNSEAEVKAFCGRNHGTICTSLPISRSIYPNMAKIDLQKLCQALEHPGQINVVAVEQEHKEQAKMALKRMLALPAL